MGFWNRKSREITKVRKAALKKQIKDNETFAAVEQRAGANVLLWLKEGIDQAFKELRLRELLILAIKNLEQREPKWAGMMAAIEEEMKRIVAPPAVEGENVTVQAEAV